MRDLRLRSDLPIPDGERFSLPWGYWKEKAAAMEIGNCYEVNTVIDATALRQAMVGLYGKRSSMRRRDKETGLFVVWRVK